jgi:limonene-1,2-epoxide hydrolase
MSESPSHAIPTNGHVGSQPAEVVLTFLQRLQAGAVDAATDLLAPDVRFENVSLPAIRGRDRTRRALKSMMGLSGAGFEVRVHSITSDGSTVMTERTDIFHLRRLRAQVWVCGRFDVIDGQITLWREYFDWWDVGLALVRAVLGAVIPSLQHEPPESRV